MGVKLFRRVKQGARLTSAGEALIAPARLILRDFEEAQAAVRNVEGLRAGRLVVVAPPYLAADPLPRLLGPFHERYPEVAIRIDNALDEDVLAVLRSGEADVALAFTDPEDPTAIATRLADEEIVIVMPPGTDGFGPVVPVAALADVKLISPTVPEHVKVIRRVRAAGITSPVLVETIHRVATVPLILAASARHCSPDHSPAKQWPWARSNAAWTRPCTGKPSSSPCRPSSPPPPERFSSSSRNLKRHHKRDTEDEQSALVSNPRYRSPSKAAAGAPVTPRGVKRQRARGPRCPSAALVTEAAHDEVAYAKCESSPRPASPGFGDRRALLGGTGSLPAALAPAKPSGFT